MFKVRRYRCKFLTAVCFQSEYTWRCSYCCGQWLAKLRARELHQRLNVTFAELAFYWQEADRCVFKRRSGFYKDIFPKTAFECILVCVSAYLISKIGIPQNSQKLSCLSSFLLLSFVFDNRILWYYWSWKVSPDGGKRCIILITKVHKETWPSMRVSSSFSIHSTICSLKLHVMDIRQISIEITEFCVIQKFSRLAN